MGETARHALGEITADTLFAMPDDGLRHELVRGAIRTMTPTGGLHGIIVVRITAALYEHVEAQQLGYVFGAETGFRLATAPDTVRAPDIAFVRRERIPATGLPEKFWPGAPDLAVEVLSPDDRIHEVDEKVDDWLASGTREVWVVNPRRRTVAVHRADRSPVILHPTDQLDGGDLLPAFRCPVARLFPAKA
jgi:Uma2 family endonuclease